MNIEELSKSQLILLTILVNFVTSVATGILTVSLLDQAPPLVTQTVDRVVEHTIETVTKAVPAAVAVANPTPSSSPAPSNQDLVTAALAADGSRIVGIYDNVNGTSTPAAAVGAYLPTQRVVVTTLSSGPLPKEALVAFQDGSLVPASLSLSGNGLAVYGFAGGAVLPKLAAAALLSGSELKLGQTALAVTANGTAATGIVSKVGAETVKTTLPDPGAGIAVVNLSGDIIGIAPGGSSSLIPASLITGLLTATSTSGS